MRAGFKLRSLVLTKKISPTNQATGSHEINTIIDNIIQMFIWIYILDLQTKKEEIQAFIRQVLIDE